MHRETNGIAPPNENDSHGRFLARSSITTADRATEK